MWPFKPDPTRCYNGGQRHRFAPRVTEHFIPHPFKMESGCTEEVILKAMERGERVQTYHGDVCEWCGKAVNAPVKG